MRGLVISAAVLAAMPAAAAERQKVVVLSVQALDAEAAQGDETAAQRLAIIVTEQLTRQLASQDVEVIGSRDLASLISIERQRQLLGCSDESTSCLQEISDALGAPLTVTGTLSIAGKAMRLDVKLIRTRDAHVLFREGTPVERREDVFDALGPIARRIAGVVHEVERGLPGGTGPAAQAGTTSIRLGPVLVTAAGAIALVVGAVLWALQGVAASNLAAGIEAGTVEIRAAVSARDSIYTQRSAAAVLTAVGMPLAAAGLAWGFIW